MVGILFGAGVGALIITDIAQPVLIWGAPVLGWFLALAVLVCIMRSSRFTAVGDLLLALALVPLLTSFTFRYVPLVPCSQKSWIPSNDYGPAPNGVIIGSTVAFLVILLSIALILRFSFGLRQLLLNQQRNQTMHRPTASPVDARFARGLFRLHGACNRVAGLLIRRRQSRLALSRLQRIGIAIGGLIGATFAAKLPFALTADPTADLAAVWLGDGKTILWDS